MRYLLLSCFFLLFVSVKGQETKELDKFAIQCQKAFNERKIIPQESFGFYKIRDSIFVNEKFSAILNPIIRDNLVFQDSVVYDFKVTHVLEADTVILDVFKRFYKIDDRVFPTYMVNGEFHGGVRQFNSKLAHFLNERKDMFEVDSIAFSLYLYDRINADLLYVKSSLDNWSDSVFMFWEENNIQYVPPVYYGKLMYSIHDFHAIKEDNGLFAVESVDYGEFSALVEYNSTIYGISHEKVNKLVKMKTIYYDKKNSVEQIIKDNNLIDLDKASFDAYSKALNNMKKAIGGISGMYYLYKHL